MKKIFVLAMVLITFCVGLASAAYLPNSTQETQGISTLTTIQCSGVVFESEDYVNAISNMNTPMAAPLMDGEVMSINSYNQNVLARGDVSYVKAFEADTRDMDANTNNVDVLTIASIDNGKMLFDDSIMVEASGTSNGKKSPAQICPFDKQTTTNYAPFCERIVGSTDANIANGAIVTSVGTRNIADNFNVPMDLAYDVEAEGEGSITIQFDVNALEARGNGEFGKTVTDPAKYTASKFSYTPSEFGYTPSQYSQEYWSTNKCFPVLNPSTYTPEEATYTQEEVSYKPSKFTPAKQISVTEKGPSSTIDYHEKTTAIGTFTVTKSMSYTSGNFR
jgi:hypothetical protein